MVSWFSFFSLSPLPPHPSASPIYSTFKIEHKWVYLSPPLPPPLWPKLPLPLAWKSAYSLALYGALCIPTQNELLKDCSVPFPSAPYPELGWRGNCPLLPLQPHCTPHSHFLCPDHTGCPWTLQARSCPGNFMSASPPSLHGQLLPVVQSSGQILLTQRGLFYSVTLNLIIQLLPALCFYLLLLGYLLWLKRKVWDLIWALTQVLYICQNSSSCVLKTCVLYCKLYYEE